MEYTQNIFFLLPINYFLSWWCQKIVGGMIKLNVHHNWRLHKCVGMNVSAYNNLREWQKREFGYTCQIITHEVTRRKWSRDGSCRVTHVRSGMHKMTYIYLSINIKIWYFTFLTIIPIIFKLSNYRIFYLYRAECFIYNLSVSI